jgi:hypothetical protein
MSTDRTVQECSVATAATATSTQQLHSKSSPKYECTGLFTLALHIALSGLLLLAYIASTLRLPLLPLLLLMLLLLMA